MDRFAIDNRASRNPAAPNRPLGKVHWDGAVMCSDMKLVMLTQENNRIIGLAKPASTFGESPQDGLDIGRRSCNHAKYLARRRLLFERFTKLATTRLHLVEQTNILDCDHRLVGEGSDQLDLLISEWRYYLPAQCQHADWIAFAQ